MKPVSLVMLALASTACIPSNVVAPQDRAVDWQTQPHVWQASSLSQLTGLYQSDSIEGTLADSLVRVWYLFDATGSYSGAAIVRSPDGQRFQTLLGRYALRGDQLSLDDGDAGKLEVDGAYLRWVGADGALILQAVDLR